MIPHWRALAAVAVPTALAACSGPDLVNALVPRDGYRVANNIAYGAAPRQRLDVYLPDDAAARMATVIFFYGGGWSDGDKDDYLFVGQAFAARGYAVVIPAYRLYPEIVYPAFLQDLAAAVAWTTRRMAAEVGTKPAPLFFVGHSAGAYNAAMLALDERWLAAHGLTPCETVAAVVGLAGPYDFLPLDSRKLEAIFGVPTPPETQPIRHVDGRTPPMLLISGLDDEKVLPRNSRNLAARLRENGGAAEERYYDGIGHIRLVGALATPLRGLAPTLDDVDEFLQRTGATTCDRLTPPDPRP